MTGPIKKQLHAFGRHLKKDAKHPNTIRSYTADVELFFEWYASTVGPDFALASITSGDVKDYRSYLLTRRTSTSSINRRLTSLRQFFEFAIQEKACAQNPVAAIPALETEIHMPVILSRKEQLLLLRTAEKTLRPLETSIVLLLLHGGLRAQEICALTIGDLHLTPRKAKLFIRGESGRKLRFVFLSTRTQAAMRTYCRRKGISILSRIRRDEPLLTQLNSTPLTVQVIDSIVRRIGKLAGIAYVTATVLRNTYAVQTLLNGEAPDKLGRALGMSSTKNLQRLVSLIKEQE